MFNYLRFSKHAYDSHREVARALATFLEPEVVTPVAQGVQAIEPLITTEAVVKTEVPVIVGQAVVVQPEIPALTGPSTEAVDSELDEDEQPQEKSVDPFVRIKPWVEDPLGMHPLPPTSVESRSILPTNRTRVVAIVGGVTGTGVLALSLKTTVLVAGLHFGVPIAAAAAVPYGINKFMEWMKGDPVEMPDLEKDMNEIATNQSIDPELLAYACSATAGCTRSAQFATSLKSKCNQWVDKNRKKWSEVVKFSQVQKTVVIAMSYTGVEDTRRGWWGSDSVFASIGRADRITNGQVGRLRFLPTT
jgi:hypothetical protein